MSLILNSGHAITNKPQDNINKTAFIIKYKNQDITHGPCDTRQAPFSTFKVALALIGFDSKILESEDSPKWSFKEEYEKNFGSWYTRKIGLKYNWIQDQTPKTFMKNSVVWFSHQITERLGKEKFQYYIKKLNYGNEDISGTPGKDDGLLNSWLGTSLKISPREQLELIVKLLKNELDVSKDAQEKTRKVMDREEEWEGWKLYGKTGGGHGQTGWFVGWIEKESQKIPFAIFFNKQDTSIDLPDLSAFESFGLKAKEVIKREVLKILYTS